MRTRLNIQIDGKYAGLLIAKPNALILYATLAKGPKLPYEDQINSSRQFMRELNRLGVIDDGYEVYIVTDASGGVSPEAHEMANEPDHPWLSRHVLTRRSPSPSRNASTSSSYSRRVTLDR